MQQSTVSVDDTRVDYILFAVESARKAFPCHLIRRKNDSQAGSGPHVGVNSGDDDHPAHDHLDRWTDEHVSDVNGFMEDKVTS